MAECAFHQEARRRQANLDRQQEARKRFIARQSQNMSGALDPNLSGGNDAIMFSGADNFDTKRCSKIALQSHKPEDGVVFKEVVHDPNFMYRSLKESGCDPLPLHVDPIFKIMYPGF
ncbi:uncharacterized protein LOC110447519 isoform X4 [Mizuhopecten yessoensis]|uniref:uncharacterized protein LOC110447519 isoform X4 n=1 Tax=Mizuhopecten yessoensis TaxID=6573 RepID=UPI000B4591ED|nr:uncharacterized protein LOC110447519 isoform X4 [Mizuhopecten yessoensis]XP_021348956.1 uncharacterized protein LOC110447519 isoform X4 [Mizuhopecten yessoensis]